MLRYGPHAVSSGLDPEPKRRLMAFLTGLREADPDTYERLEMHRGGGFTAASQADYAASARYGADAGRERGRKPNSTSGLGWPIPMPQSQSAQGMVVLLRGLRK